MFKIIRIPRIIEPDEDETFASWIIRLAKENVISDTRSFILAFIYPNEPGTRKTFPQMDHRIPFELFWKALECVHEETDESELFIRTSTFTGTSPFMPEEQRQRYINQAFYTDKRMEALFPVPHGTIDGLYICPECVAGELQDKGYFTLHRAHHLPGVTMCHKHRCALGKITDKYLNLCPDKVPKYTGLNVTDPSLAHKYAVFAKDFMDEKPDCSQKEVVSLILEKKTNETASLMAQAGYSAIVDRLDTFFTAQLRSRYLSASSVMAVLMYLFDGDARAVAKALQEKVDPRVREEFFRKLGAGEYSLVSRYRNDIVTLRHDKCGETFCTSPYGFLSGWKCPSCSKNLTLQEQYEELIKNIGDGEYTPLSPFTSMDRRVSLLHQKCGKKLSLKARAFLYEGVRCDCGYRVDYDVAKEKIEKNEGFSLVEFISADKPVKIRHKCGGEFSIHYEKFLESPRCRVCQRQGHLDIRTTNDLVKDISDLTGNEYTLLDTYEGARTPVKIRHNICKTVQEYMPHRFLDGQRCRKCRKILTEREFSEYVKQYSLGRYEVTGRPTRNMYRIHDNVTGEDREMLKAKALQELSRPTPSPLLPLDGKGDPEPVRNKRKSEGLLSYLAEHFGDELIFAEDIQYKELQGDALYDVLSGLVKGNHLRRHATGIYTISEKTFSDDDLIVARYLKRYGHRIGFLRGASYAGMLGLADKPTAWHIATNKESFKTANRKTRFLGKDIHIKGMPVEITDKNYIVLEAVDFLVQYKQCTTLPVDEVITAVRRHLIEENGGKLPERKQFDELINGYRTANIRTMMTRLIDMLYMEGGENAKDN